MEAVETVMQANPSARQRIYAWMGFRHPKRVELPDPQDGFVEGDILTEITIRFDWKDRLRVLWAGRVDLRVSTQTDKPVERSKAFASVGVPPPETRRQVADRCTARLQHR